MKPADLEMLRRADVPTHGVRLEPGSVRDRLRKAGLIVGRRPNAGHGKSWIATPAGRAALKEHMR